MAGFATVVEGLVKVKTLLDKPFTNPVADAAECCKLIGKALEGSADFCTRIRDEGLIAVGKHENVGEAVENLYTLIDSIVNPSKVDQVGQVQMRGEKQFVPIQQQIQMLFGCCLDTLVEKVADYRDPENAVTKGKPQRLGTKIVTLEHMPAEKASSPGTRKLVAPGIEVVTPGVKLPEAQHQDLVRKTAAILERPEPPKKTKKADAKPAETPAKPKAGQ